MSTLYNSIYAILLAGGTGTRYGGDKPKQFLELQGETLIRRSVRRFKNWGVLKSIVVVLNIDFIMTTESTLADLLDNGDRIVEGGSTRHESTINGLRSLKKMGIREGDQVFIHDVARPFFLYSELDELLQRSREVGAATLATRNTDTILREAEDRVVGEIVPREGLYRVKTPQIATWNVLEKLLNHSFHNEPTDLCTWCKVMGLPTAIVSTGEWNIKITNPGDRELSEAIYSGLRTIYPDLR